MFQIRRFRDFLFEYYFAFPWENPTPEKPMNFSDFSATRQFLTNVLHDSSAVQVFRSILANTSEVGPLQISRLGDHEVIDILARLLMSGRIKLYRQKLPTYSFQERTPIAITKAPTVAPTLSWVEVAVVWDDTDKPIPNLQLVVVTPDGQRNVKQTDSDGRLRLDQITEGMCEVRCSTSGSTLDECVTFIGEGQQQAAQQGSAPQQNSTTTKSSNPVAIALIEAHKVKTGETLGSVASAVGITSQDLAYFNWGTKVQEEIDKHLMMDVGCIKKTADGKNFVFDDSDKPGIVFVPKQPFYRAGTGIKHTMRVSLVKKRKKVFTLSL